MFFASENVWFAALRSIPLSELPYIIYKTVYMIKKKKFKKIKIHPHHAHLTNTEFQFDIVVVDRSIVHQSIATLICGFFIIHVWVLLHRLLVSGSVFCQTSDEYSSVETRSLAWPQLDNWWKQNLIPAALGAWKKGGESDFSGEDRVRKGKIAHFKV